MTIAATPPTAIPAPTASLAARAASVAPPAASVTGADASVTPEAASAKRSHKTLRAVMWLALIGGAILAGIGFTGSYSALQALGESHGLGRFSHAFPIGVDAGIVVLLALDMLLVWRRTPWPVLRLLAHLFTAATIVFNAASSPGPVAADPLGAALHGIIPIMFVAAVEAGRRLILRITALEDGRDTAGIPVTRWFLAFPSTFALWRRMKLWDVPTYGEAVMREQSLKVYRVILEREYGSVRKAPSDVRLPLTMAPYGLTIDEALALPREHEERERLLQEAQAEADADAEARAAERVAKTEIARLKTAGAVEAARHEITAVTGQAETRARAELVAAERTAAVETEAIESATIAEAEARRAAAARLAAEDLKATAEAEADAAETKRAATEALRQAAEAEAHASELKRRAAEDETARARAVQEAAEAEQRTAEARLRTAEAERAAVEAEDEAKLTATERAVRKVARLILARGGDVNAVSLDEVGELLQLKPATASERRAQAAALIAEGYRG